MKNGQNFKLRISLRKIEKNEQLPVLANVCARYEAQNRSSRISLGLSKSSVSCEFSSRPIRERKFFHSSASKI